MARTKKISLRPTNTVTPPTQVDGAVSSYNRVIPEPYLTGSRSIAKIDEVLKRLDRSPSNAPASKSVDSVRNNDGK